jgi:ABC-type uncharacterized transport system substrate-binding protein
MRKVSLSQTLSAILLAAALTCVVVFNFNKPRIMVLHSYATDYSWTRGVNTGLERVMARWTNYSVVWHYMDTKKHNDEEWLKRAGIVARQAIDKWEPNVLIAIDNDAQELAAKYYVNRPGISIVFAGINGSIDAYNYQYANNVTGILERRQLEGLRETIGVLEDSKPQDLRKAAGEAIRVFYIMDTSKPVLGDKGYIDSFDWSPLEYVGSFAASDWEAWQQKILEIRDKADYIFVTNYRQLPRSSSDRSFVPASEAMGWTEEHAAVPVVGLQVFNVEDGAMLAIGVSPFEQGEVAARMAERIIKSRRPASTIPIAPNNQFIVAIRRRPMLKYRLKLPAVYESFSRATDTYYE